MPSRLSDEREQRRGLILGLTLAEILLLLLFLLLLTLAAELKDWQDKANRATADLEQLKPIQEALFSGGATDITGVQQLVERFRHLQEVEAESAHIKEENARLHEDSKLVKSLDLDKPEALKSLASTLQRASQIDPNDPPAFLKRAVEVLDRLGRDTQPDHVKPLSQMADNTELQKKLTAAESEKEKYRLDMVNLMHSGNGLTYPSCWKTAAGQTEYIFDITFGDRGVKVHNATPGRAKDPAWNYVDLFARDSEIDEKTFVKSTKKLANWATSQNCKFYTRNWDETGPLNKIRYKNLRRTIEQNFYPYYPPAPATRRRAKSTTDGVVSATVSPAGVEATSQ